MEGSRFSNEQRLARLEAVKYLKAKCAEHLDDGYNPEGVASLFADDGLWVIKGVGGEAKGNEAIKQHCRNLSANITWALHNIVSPAVDVDRDGRYATATFYLVCFASMAPSDQTPRAKPSSSRASTKISSSESTVNGTSKKSLESFNHLIGRGCRAKQ